jgi:hypothetical protein
LRLAGGGAAVEGGAKRTQVRFRSFTFRPRANPSVRSISKSGARDPFHLTDASIDRSIDRPQRRERAAAADGGDYTGGAGEEVDAAAARRPRSRETARRDRGGAARAREDDRGARAAGDE